MSHHQAKYVSGSAASERPDRVDPNVDFTDQDDPARMEVEAENVRERKESKKKVEEVDGMLSSVQLWILS